MALFWPRAAQLLKPGGTVALWAERGGYIHDSTPNHSAIQDYITSTQEKIFRSYAKEGTKVAFGLYADLVLPWQVESDSAGSLFEEETFFKKIWSKDVVCEDGDEFFAGQASPQFLSVDIDTLEKMMGTRGTVTRWREDNAEKVGTDEDIVKMMRAEIERLLYEDGVKEGEEVLNMGVEGVLIMVKRVQ